MHFFFICYEDSRTPNKSSPIHWISLQFHEMRRFPIYKRGKVTVTLVRLMPIHSTHHPKSTQKEFDPTLVKQREHLAKFHYEIQGKTLEPAAHQSHVLYTYIVYTSILSSSNLGHLTPHISHYQSRKFLSFLVTRQLETPETQLQPFNSILSCSPFRSSGVQGSNSSKVLTCIPESKCNSNQPTQLSPAEQVPGWSCPCCLFHKQNS